jgi:5-methylcytosine-specific restriction endonuclease McrA
MTRISELIKEGIQGCDRHYPGLLFGIVPMLLSLLLLFSFAQIGLAYPTEQTNLFPESFQQLLFVLILMILCSAAVISVLRRKKRERRHFSRDVKRTILLKQKGKCKHCKSYLNRYAREFDHKNGDRSNNKGSNCQALCSNCHAKKSRSCRNKSFFNW